jgi:hypothetical protein
MCVKGKRGVIIHVAKSIQLDEAEMGRHHELYLFSDSFLYFEVVSKIENRFTTATNQDIIGFVFYLWRFPSYFTEIAVVK